MHHLLKTHFGYDHFRPLQEDIIRHVLAKQDALVLMSTGGGKSLCYQLPALALEGVTLVISPLIALMKDQVDGLRARGITAAYLNSTLDQHEQDRIQAAAIAGKIKILYLAPERFSTSAFKSFASRLTISLIAVDEAHCISEWGHDFRPDYRNLRELKAIFPHTPIIALTATATHTVQRDILTQLGLPKTRVFRSSFNRPNVRYTVIPKRQGLQDLLYLLQQHQGEATIIYCFSRKDTERIAESLCEHGLRARAYHAGLSPELRRKTQELFLKNDLQVIVATIAFGMGIDKPNIRLVIHYDLPKSIEGYFQETGRAGRDGLPSECVLLYSYGDKMKQDYFIRQIEDSRERAIATDKLATLIQYCEQSTCRRAYLLGYFNEPWTTKNCKSCDICLQSDAHLEDATTITQTILFTVIQTGERFGTGHIIDILRGSKRQTIRDRGHDALPSFGSAKQASAEQLRHTISCLLAKELLIKNPGDYPTLGIGQRGKIFLREKETIHLPVYIDRPLQDVTSATKSSIPKTTNRTPNETCRETQRLFTQKYSIQEIAQRRNLAESTILNHLEHLLEYGEKLDTSHISFPSDKLGRIKTVFGKNKNWSLGSARAELPADISYQDIHVARLILRTNTENKG